MRFANAEAPRGTEFRQHHLMAPRHSFIENGIVGLSAAGVADYVFV
jgi:hypothetical protein